MNGRISFHEAAEREIIDAVSFFQSERPELGGAFIDEVERSIQQILILPLSCQLVNRTVRRKVLRRFPYNIMYSVKPEAIRILAIARDAGLSIGAVEHRVELNQLTTRILSNVGRQDNHLNNGGAEAC